MAAAGRRFFRLARGVEVAVLTVTKEQALDVQYELAKNTPVDVATARSNWRIAISRPHVGKIKAYRPFRSRHKPPYPSGGTMAERANLQAVKAQGIARLRTYTKGSIYISNNLPYIGPLDRGHSPQSSGFVSRSIMTATSRTKAKIKPIFDRELSK